MLDVIPHTYQLLMFQLTKTHYLPPCKQRIMSVLCYPLVCTLTSQVHSLNFRSQVPLCPFNHIHSQRAYVSSMSMGSVSYG